MLDNKLQELTMEQLQSKKKTLKLLLILIVLVLIFYALFFIFKLVSGTWEAKNPLGIVGLAMLLIASSVINIQHINDDQELKNRRESKES